MYIKIISLNPLINSLIGVLSASYQRESYEIARLARQSTWRESRSQEEKREGLGNTREGRAGARERGQEGQDNRHTGERERGGSGGGYRHVYSEEDIGQGAGGAYNRE